MTETFGSLNKILAIYVLNEAFEKAEILIGLIKKEYHLK